MRNPFRRRTASVPYLPKLDTPSPDRVDDFRAPMFWGASQAAVQSIFDASQNVGSGVHFADNFLTWLRNNSMLDDGEFVKAWESNAETNVDRAIIWRRYVLACAGYHCVQLDGDFVECGAYTGVGVKTVLDYLGGPRFAKSFWIYDLFEHREDMLHHAMPEHGPGLHERITQKFRDYPQVKVFKGHIPEVFEGKGRSPRTIAYLHIDLNQAPAEIAALDALFERIVPGGIVILDDYEWAGIYRGQKLAEDAWLDARRYRVMPLPTGQGLVIKR